MDPDTVVRLRLHNQMLRGPAAASPETALRNLLAVQSQEFPYARWTLAQRTSAQGNPAHRITAQPAPATSAADIEQAVADGRILRTHILRPTWHFVHRDDLRWLLALSAPRLHQGNAGMYRQTGIDAATAARSAKVLAKAVEGGHHLTREQLAARLQDAGFAGKGLELAYLIMHAEISGVLVSGSPVRSAGGALKQTYALFDERVPAGPEVPPTRAEALTELVRRYFTSRGPATVKDCADWSGLTMAEVRQGLQLALDSDPDALGTAVIDGAVFYFRAGMDAAADPKGSRGGEIPDGQGPRVDLIQCYDEYVMGYSATRHYLGGRAPAFPVAGAPIHVVLLDGRMVGSWRHTLLPGRCELDILLFDPGSPGQPVPHGSALDDAVDTAISRYAGFLGIPAVRMPSGSKLEGHR
ncbi:MAG: winged helix DNA-binding domain-containing protein [Actinomycetota bacterium]|nr:winged helix DNA-binding domain-containing protein [Actinomycetota bacterium]